MKISTAIAAFLSILVFGSIEPGHAQPTPKGKAAPPAVQAPAPQAPQAQPAPAQQPATAADAAPANQATSAGWVARCSSAGRTTPLECAMEQSAVLSKTGQLIVLINIRVPADTHVPVALVQLPLGLNVPVGAKIQVDDGKATDLPIQTCENRGCFAGSPIPPDLLAAMRSGKLLKVSFQNLSKETMTVPMPLTDFAPAYDKIK